MAGALVAGLFSGCGLSPTTADRLFRAGDLAAAEAVYRSDLESGRLEGRRRERALFHLGLIHARPGGELHDPAAARRYLERLVAVDPPSPYALQAAVVLDLQLEILRLRAGIVDQKDLARLLLAELRALRSEAERIETEASDEQQRALTLARRIQRLETEMEALARELAAREEELERLKRIDLEDPP